MIKKIDEFKLKYSIQSVEDLSQYIGVPDKVNKLDTRVIANEVERKKEVKGNNAL